MPNITPAPVAKKISHRTSHHGIDIDDPYHWLRADNWQEVMVKPEVLPADIAEYLEAENTYFVEEFDQKNEDLQENIYREIRGRIKEDESSVPSPDGEFSYYTKMETGQQYPLLMRTDRTGDNKICIMDCNAEAGEGYFGFAGAAHDPSHRFLAWGCDRNGSEYYTIRVRNIETGGDTIDILEKSAGSAVWSRDSSSIFYVELDSNHRPFRVRQHILGTDQSTDTIVYEEADAGFFVNIGKTLSGNFIIISSSDHQTSEIHLLDAHKGGALQLISQREPGHEYSVEERHGELFILTNKDGAEDFKVVKTSLNTPDINNWQDFIPHQSGTLILSTIVLENHLIRLEKFEGLPRIVMNDLRDDKETHIAFDEEAYSLGVSAGYEFDTDTIRFTYSSPTTPSQVFDYNLATCERILRKEQIIPSGHNPQDYVTRRIMARASDGAEIPVTLLYHKDTSLDGSAPCLLYGYGAYGISMPANFSITSLSLVDRGFVYAIAHIRGGKDKGYDWYKKGRAEHKVNTFTDFIAVAEHLGTQKTVAKDKIIAMGGSAGGLLMGAITNMRPDLFAGVIAQVPFVDVLNTMLDDTLPLTPPEWPEWGNPIASKEAYEHIASYSPYDNVEAKDYPAMLVLAGLTDPRVTYWEPAKWVAKLRKMKTGTQPLYLKTNMEAGHGGASGRFDRLKEIALTQAFAINIADAPAQPKDKT